MVFDFAKSKYPMSVSAQFNSHKWKTLKPRNISSQCTITTKNVLATPARTVVPRRLRMNPTMPNAIGGAAKMIANPKIIPGSDWHTSIPPQKPGGGLQRSENRSHRRASIMDQASRLTNPRTAKTAVVVVGRIT